MPALAAEGEKALLLMPVPVKRPPAGLPLRASVPLSTHRVFGSIPNETTGKAFTVISAIVDEAQPSGEVPVTVYDVLAAGLAVNEEEALPVFQL